MPSWNLHNKWASKMEIPLDVSNKVNKIIDGPVHDLGEIKKIPIGKSIPIRPGIEAKFPKMNIRTDDILRESLENEFLYDPIKLRYAYKAAILHHWLDKIAKTIEMFGIKVIRDVEFVIGYAEHLLTIHLDGNAYDEVRKFVKKNAKDIIQDIAEELIHKGVLEIGPESFFHILNEFRKKNGWPGLIYIDELLPIKAAANRIYHRLKAGERVTFYFAYSGSTWQTHIRVSPVFEVESIGDAITLFLSL